MTVKFFAVGPTAEAYLYVSRFTTAEQIAKGEFQLTSKIEEAFIWKAVNFAQLFANNGAGFRVKPLENTEAQDGIYYLHVTQGEQSIDVGYHPMLSRHPQASVGYEGLLEALSARIILERNFPHLGALKVSEQRGSLSGAGKAAGRY